MTLRTTQSNASQSDTASSNNTQPATRWYHWIIGILGLSTVIIAHEMGHFLACKLFHVGTPLFSIGFGPQLFAFTIKSTTFQLAALPLGGYVSIDPTSFATQPYLVKMFIMIAGILFNFLFAAVAFTYLTYRKSNSTYNATIINDMPNIHPHTDSHTNTNKSLNSESYSPTEIKTHPDIHSSTETHPYPESYESSHTHTENYSPTPVETYPDTHSHDLHKPDAEISMHPHAHARILSLSHAFTQKQTPRNRLKILQQTSAALFAQEGTSGIIGPIGIISLTGKSLAHSKDLFIFTLALLSINIGIFNLLPIPGLDGSQLLMLIIEKFVGPLSSAFEWTYLIMFILLALFMLFISFKDIKRLRD